MKPTYRTSYFSIPLVLLWSAGAFAGFFGPSNYWECILEEMPGVKNDPSAIEVIRKCRKDFPFTPSVEKKSPIFGVKTSGECVLKYAKDVSSPRGAKIIRAACYKLYPKVSPDELKHVRQFNSNFLISCSDEMSSGVDAVPYGLAVAICLCASSSIVESFTKEQLKSLDSKIASNHQLISPYIKSCTRSEAPKYIKTHPEFLPQYIRQHPEVLQ